MKVRKAKVTMARGKSCPYKMGCALLPEFFTQEELKTCTTVKQRTGQTPRPQTDNNKLECVSIIYDHIIIVIIYIFITQVKSGRHLLGL